MAFTIFSLFLQGYSTAPAEEFTNGLLLQHLQFWVQLSTHLPVSHSLISLSPQKYVSVFDITVCTCVSLCQCCQQTDLRYLMILQNPKLCLISKFFNIHSQQGPQVTSQTLLFYSFVGGGTHYHTPFNPHSPSRSVRQSLRSSSFANTSTPEGLQKILSASIHFIDSMHCLLTLMFYQI